MRGENGSVFGRIHSAQSKILIRGTDVMILKIFSPKKFGEKIGIFLLKLLLVFEKY
jgi:hypothetical protein